MIRARARAVAVTAALAATAALIVPAAVALPASASTYSQVLKIYENQGSIPACQFSSRQLESALKSVDTYGAQYFADFSTAIQNALDQRASGTCSGGRPAVTGALPTGKAALPRVALTGSTSSGLPAPIALMAGLLALIAMGAAVLFTARARGWDPAWAAGWRHAWSEAGYRVGGTWAEFRDWLGSRP